MDCGHQPKLQASGLVEAGFWRQSHPVDGDSDVGLNDTTYSDTGLTGGVTYRYRVRSYKQMVDGNYGESGHAEAVIP